MSSREKIKWISATLLIIQLAAGLAINWKIYPVDSPVMGLYALLSLFSILWVLVAFLMGAQIRPVARLLKGEYLAMYKTAANQFSRMLLSDPHRIAILEDTLERLLRAQRSSRPARQAIPDPQEFIIRRSQAYASARRSIWPDGLQYFAVLVLAAQVAGWLASGSQDFFAIQMPRGLIGLLLVVAFGILPIWHLIPRQSWTRFVLLLANGALVLLAVVRLLLFQGVDGRFVRWLAEDTVRLIANGWQLTLVAGTIPVLVWFKQVHLPNRLV